MGTHPSRTGQKWRRDTLRLLDPVLRRAIGMRPWRGVADAELEQRVAELPRAPEPVRGARTTRWTITPTKH